MQRTFRKKTYLKPTAFNKNQNTHQILIQVRIQYWINKSADGAEDVSRNPFKHL